MVEDRILERSLIGELIGVRLHPLLTNWEEGSDYLESDNQTFGVSEFTEMTT